MGAQELWRPQWVRLLVKHMAVERMIFYTGLSMAYLVQVLTRHLHLEVTISFYASRPLQQRFQWANFEYLSLLAEPCTAICLWLCQCLPLEMRPFLDRNQSALNVLSNLIYFYFPILYPSDPTLGVSLCVFRSSSKMASLKSHRPGPRH